MARKVRPKRPRAKANVPPKAPGQRAGDKRPAVTFRSLSGEGAISHVVPRDVPLPHLARKWSYILRARSRWRDDPDIRDDISKEALTDLQDIGVPLTFVQRLTAVKHVEVEVHAPPEDNSSDPIHEAASEMSWEFLLSEATRVEGRTSSYLITRLLDNKRPATKQPQPGYVLFVESAPGKLGEAYEFDTERERINAAVCADDNCTMSFLLTPTPSELASGVRSHPWKAIHVTGLDVHHAAQYLGDIYDREEKKNSDTWKKITDPSGRMLDGMILTDRNVAELPVRFDELAALIVDQEHPPQVVTMNLYHSGARIARELVRCGAQAALGFLDEINDEAAERFFQEFYTAWCRPVEPLTITQAFVAAWQALSSDNLYGTGIVIWMGRRQIEEFRSSFASLAPSAPTAPPAPTAESDGDPKEILAIPIERVLQVDCSIPPEVNYSLLHNDRPLLDKLTLTPLVRQPLRDITVRVELNVGAQSYPYRYTRPELSKTQLALASEVKIPLTTNLQRSLRERVHSTVYVKVTCGGRTAYEETKRVTLIPVDEWLDDTNNNPWLPSFVLPRDPAVVKIIAVSRRYLIGIEDDPAAGFDGYQSTGDVGIDNQVRAIWTALVNEFRLQYVNPPPTYSRWNQRLRTPSEILDTGSGTCIDLALLFASCLEYIDIHPVVVLLSGHAFVGYWRSERARSQLVGVKRIPRHAPVVGSRVARKAALPYVDPYGWSLGKLSYDEIVGFVTAGDLVLLEATMLTSASSFSDAVEEGRANMRSRREFDSLLEILLARSARPSVTPLPIVGE
jgi:hypothetical protein